MQLSIRNKWISFAGSSTVKDMNEKDVLTVKGKFLSITQKKFIFDMQGNLLFVVRNKFWRLWHRKAFVLNPQNEQVALVRRKLFSLHDHYYITSSLGDLQIRGNILLFNYDILLDGKKVGHISRKISARDSFVLDIDDKYDYATFVALVIAIELITNQRQNSESSSSWSSSN